MRVLRWERYVPDVEDNRERHARGEPAMVVELRAPSSGLWRRVWAKVLEETDALEKLRTFEAQYGPDAGAGRMLKQALFGDAVTEVLWLGCVGPVEIPAGLIDGLETPIRDGRALWAARDVLDAPGLFANILSALVDRADLERGLARPLVSPHGPSPSPERDGSPGGIVASAVPPA